MTHKIESIFTLNYLKAGYVWYRFSVASESKRFLRSTSNTRGSGYLYDKPYYPTARFNREIYSDYCPTTITELVEFDYELSVKSKNGQMRKKHITPNNCFTDCIPNEYFIVYGKKKRVKPVLLAGYIDWGGSEGSRNLRINWGYNGLEDEDFLNIFDMVVDRLRPTTIIGNPVDEMISKTIIIDGVEYVIERSGDDPENAIYKRISEGGFYDLDINDYVLIDGVMHGANEVDWNIDI